MKPNTQRFRVYCPSQWRNRPARHGFGPLAALSPHSRPVYRVLDFASLAKGNNPETPEHTTAKPVADRLDYLAAMTKARELNAKPDAQRVFELAQVLRANDCDTPEEAARLLATAKKVDAAARELAILLAEGA